MPWSGNKAPEQSTDEGQSLALWVEDELERFAADQLENLLALDLRPTFNAPLRPREGMIVYADGTKWNPGSGAKPYYYSNLGLWVPWGGVGREVLAAARTYYVRADGNDSNTGLVNSAGGAFLTIAHAMVVVGALDCGSYQLTIEVQAGTFAEAVILPRMLAAIPPILTGVGATTIISVSSGTNACVHSSGTTPWQINNMKLVNSSVTGGVGIWAQGVSLVYFSGIEFGACVSYQMLVQAGSALICNGNYSISGGAGYHAVSAGYIGLGGYTCTLSGTPAFSVAFILAESAGYLWAFNSVYSGSATGVRYVADLNGVIFTGGGGANFFPGNSAGSTATGGQYV